MLILFVRVIILYLLVFVIIRFTGKRQISDLQPFDLIMTLLIADLASEPASDMSIPLLYGVVPILALFLMQRLIAFLALKSLRLRTLICGSPLILIKDGIVQTRALFAARYTLYDLLEQLRVKDIFEIGDVAYAVLETNGALSVLLKGDKQPPTSGALALPPPSETPPYILVLEGQVQHAALRQAGYDANWLQKRLSALGNSNAQDYLYAMLSGDTVYAQTRGENACMKQCKIGGNAA